MTLPVTVIGGYLGAGKTTLVNHLLRNADGDRIAVLVNEFGQLPIDQDLIEEKDGNLISIAGGCVCCSYGNDLIFALMELAKREPAPDYVLLEASGVALPGAIAASVSLMENYRLEGVVVLVNAETIIEQANDTYVGDTITRQLDDADMVLLNKTDLVEEDALPGIADWLKTAAAGAQIVPAQQCIVPKNVVLQEFPDSSGTQGSALAHDTGVFTTHYFDFALTGMVDDVALASGLADIDLAIIRAKGFVYTRLGMKAIQVVGRRWSTSDASKSVKPGIVVIGINGQFDLTKVAQVMEKVQTQ